MLSISKAFVGILFAGLFITCTLIFSDKVQAQEQRVDPLTVSFVPMPPFAMLDKDGERTGFLVELAELIGTEIGVPIEFVDAADTTEFVQAQKSGETQMIAGIAKLPPLETTNVFSNAVANDRLRLAVLGKNSEDLASGDVAGLRIGIVPPALGSEERALLDRNDVVEFDSPEAAVMGLLIGSVDALLIPEPVTYSIARRARDDGRIRFIGEPIRQVDRVVALHESRSDLLEPINVAIAQLEADGRLEELRTRFNVTVPPPPPDVLTVGFSEFPPYKFVGPDGEPTGFGVEVLQGLLDRAGLAYDFVQISEEDWRRGPRDGAFDLMTLTNIGPAREAAMDLTLPVLETRISIFTRSGEARGLSELADLEDHRVGVLENHLGQTLVEAYGGLDVVVFTDRFDLLSALLNDDIDAVVFTATNFDAMAEARGTVDQITEVQPPLHVTRAAPALRLGLGEIREQLNAVIPGYLVSPEYAALREKYFGEPIFWTRARINSALAGTSLVVLLALGGIGGWNLRQREKQAAEVASIKDELETVFNAASSGIVALNTQGQIERINNPARHFLGGMTDAVPFAWPSHIKFLDGETLEPLEASADPLRRALLGHEISHQTHLMSRAKEDEDQRYVRISSTKLDNAPNGLSVVFVLDDISVEERNRQVIERRSRLDALGQLTGGIAHDFNNLLAAQLYAIDLAGKATEPSKRSKFLDVAKNSIQRGRALTSRLLAFARKQPGLASSRHASVVFGEFEKLVSPMLEAHIEVTYTVDEPELRVFCDQTQLETALMNLVLNSRDAILQSGRGSRIDLRARAVQSADGSVKSDAGTRNRPGSASMPDGHILRYVEFLVSDNGPGMDEETLVRCIDPFFTTKDSNSGTGLGLAMVYGFVRQSDGDFRIYSEEGVGTTVRMVLPRGSEEGAREDAVPDEPPPRGNGEMILVVEDELQLLTILTEVLLDLGYQVTSAQSGQEALQVFHDDAKIEILLTDVVMPGPIGGFELARRLRQERPDLPVIYTSGYTGFTASEMGDVQAQLLQKPATPKELSEAIFAALKGAP